MVLTAMSPRRDIGTDLGYCEEVCPGRGEEVCPEMCVLRYVSVRMCVLGGVS